MPRHIIMKLLKTNEKEKEFKRTKNLECIKQENILLTRKHQFE